MTTVGRRSEIPYSALDRLLHRVAFASVDLQRAIGEIEGRVCSSRFDARHARRPVFVTSLPRAGTTILLDVLATLPEFAAATYRHMPFPLAPLLWSRISRPFQSRGEMAERAHGDGIAVSVDSPEAFEEVVWMAFWPDHYRKTHIRPWTPEATSEGFEPFLREHMAKVVAAKGMGAERYLSKNNANIARVALLERLFPDGNILVPVRHPWAQVASLMRQHRRFADLHAREPFARRYMESLGHFEFGEALRPIAFAGVSDRNAGQSAEFWLAYWCDAYEAVLAGAGERTLIVDHDALSADPASHLPGLAAALHLAEPDALLVAADRFRPSSPIPPPDAPPALLRRAADIHARLLGRAGLSLSRIRTAQ